MFSAIQRTKILTAINVIAVSLGLTVLEERRKIENLDDFPLLQTTFQSEGRRQLYWDAQLHDYQDPITHEWQTLYGHYAQATISISIKSLDVDELQLKAPAFALAWWQKACGWGMECSKIEFRGTDPPKFLPPYLAADQRTNIYSCVIDAFMDYEFSWPVLAPPITNIQFDTDVGILDASMASLIDMIAIAPGSYVMSGIIGGNNSAYRMTGTIE